MQQEIYSKNRTVQRQERKGKYNKTPLEIIIESVREICDDLENFIDSNAMRKVKVSYDPALIIEYIETEFSEKQISNLNPHALVGGFMILGNNFIIDAAKVEFVFKNFAYFETKKIKQDDVVRYGRFWSILLSKEKKKPKPKDKEKVMTKKLQRSEDCDHENTMEDDIGNLVCTDCGYSIDNRI